MTTSSKRTAPCGDSPAMGDVSNDLNWATAARKERVFSSLRSALALHGFGLYRTDPLDGPVSYWAESWGLIRMFPALDTVQSFLEQQGNPNV